MNAPRTVLIVDDDVRFRRNLARELREAGWVADGVGTIREAIAWARDDAPEIAVVDLILGDESGLDFVDFLVQSCPRTLPIIATAFASRDACVRAVKLGAVDFLEKPFGVSEVFAAVERSFADARRMRLDFVKVLHCNRVLGFFRGNKSRTIQALGVSPNGFRYMLSKSAFAIESAATSSAIVSPDKE